MCDCDDKFRMLVKEKFMEDRKFEGLEIEVQGAIKLYMLDNSGTGYCTRFEGEAETTTKTGKIRRVKDNLSIMWKYCPHCGAKYE